ncbi:hypothetical protein KKC44_04075 [Patescibacteria group bacterium]|nr:hypothetical protein [Patescibacteria group bacterium]MBU2259760.1 hypothetical protein [Patescibacteria group bacterium]
MGSTVISGGLGIPRSDKRFFEHVPEQSDPEDNKRKLLGEMGVPIGQKIKHVCAEGTGE